MKNVIRRITVCSVITILLWTALAWIYQASNTDKGLFTHNYYAAIILSCIGFILTMMVWTFIDEDSFEA